MTSQVDQQMIASLLASAVKEVFTSMLGTEIEVAEGSALTARFEDFTGILSCIGMTGELIGTGMLLCGDATACDLAARFMMTEATDVNEEVQDAVGEITNMVIGGLKTALEDQGSRLDMSTPTVVHGQGLNARHVHSELTVPLGCTYEGGELVLRISLARG